MHYLHVVDVTWLAPIWFDISTYAQDYFRPTLDDACRAAARHLVLSSLVIIHGVADMVMEARFATRYYASLIVGASAFLFFVHTAMETEKLRSKSRLQGKCFEGQHSPLNGILLTTTSNQQ